MDTITIVQLIVSGMAMGAIYALVGEGFYVAFQTTKTINFGQGDFVMLGCFLTLMFIHIDLPFYVILMLIIGSLGFIGIILERIAIRPVAGAGLSFILTTMGFGMILQNSVVALWGNSAQPFPSFFGGEREKAIHKAIHIGGIGFFLEEVFILLASLIVMIVFFVFLRRTTVGKAFCAVAYNPDTASILGINVTRIKVVAYIVASVLAGISGFLIGPIVTVQPFMGFTLTIKGFVAGILGGFLNPAGILLGGLLLGLIENFLGLFTSQYGDMISFLVIIIVLIFRPSGIFGEQK
jgi:branched-chain amino acid transport system permease protein